MPSLKESFVRLKQNERNLALLSSKALQPKLRRHRGEWAVLADGKLITFCKSRGEATEYAYGNLAEAICFTVVQIPEVIKGHEAYIG